MLKTLSIDNFALIDKTMINFQPGYTVITGETGSGKSILLNALNLVLGERADYSVIGPRKDKAVVEATLDLRGFGLRGFFQLQDLDYEEFCIIRREINKEGRSRAFINDTPVSLVVLRELGSRLIHIHSQYNTLELKEPRYQLEILDILAGTAAKRDQFSAVYIELNKLRKERAILLEKLENAQKDQDYNLFQLNELESIDLDQTDYSELEERFRIFEAGDELRIVLESLVAIGAADTGFINELQELKGKFVKKKGLSDNLDQLIARFENILIEIDELNSDAERELTQLNHDPEEMARIASQLDEFNRLLFKYKKRDQAELKQYRDQLRDMISEIKDSDENIEKFNNAISEAEQKQNHLGKELHELRLKALERIEENLSEELEQLKLPDCRLNFELTFNKDADQSGMTSIAMLFSPNKGIKPVPIQKAASGGELSRVMLALQYLISQHTQLQTILFDEIDTGVSGDVAGRIGQTLRKMGECMQVIAITHLPQVAGKGTYHLRVYKLDGADGRTKTVVQTLSEDERVDEIARLMSGDLITEGARSNAKSLLES